VWFVGVEIVDPDTGEFLSGFALNDEETYKKLIKLFHITFENAIENPAMDFALKFKKILFS